MDDIDRLYKEFKEQQLIYHYSKSLYTLSWKIDVPYRLHTSKEEAVMHILKWLLNGRS